MATITADEVRYHLVSLTSVDVSDALLASAAFIAVGDAWLNKALGATYPAGLNATDQALAKAAEIAFVAERVVGSAPTRGSKTGPIEIKTIPSQDKETIVNILHNEWQYYLSLIGLYVGDGDFYVTSGGGDDYAPDGGDATQIDLADSDKDFSIFP